MPPPATHRSSPPCAFVPRGTEECAIAAQRGFPRAQSPLPAAPLAPQAGSDAAGSGSTLQRKLISVCYKYRCRCLSALRRLPSAVRMLSVFAEISPSVCSGDASAKLTRRKEAEVRAEAFRASARELPSAVDTPLRDCCCLGLPSGSRRASTSTSTGTGVCH